MFCLISLSSLIRASSVTTKLHLEMMFDKLHRSRFGEGDWEWELEPGFLCSFLIGFSRIELKPPWSLNNLDWCETIDEPGIAPPMIDDLDCC